MAPSLDAVSSFSGRYRHTDTSTKRQIVSTHPTRSLQFLEKLNITQENTAGPPLQALVKLRIIVVGAGLGGLACAIALARRGHQVVVLEQAVELGEVRLYSIFLIANYSD
jgi:heterodisulfide reductase subunit A-like polyferredoxin